MPDKKTPIKQRSQSCYQKKCDRIKKWYEHLLKERERPIIINSNTKQEPKKKELKELSYYLEKINKPRGEK